MTKSCNNFNGLNYSFSNTSPLDYEDDLEFLEWYSIEGSEHISELSRQLRSFLNYKKAIIRFRFSKSQETHNILKKDPILKWESKLSSLFSRYISLLEMIGVEQETVDKKIKILFRKVKTQPNRFEIDLLKEIKYLSGEIWKVLHVLSEFEIHPHFRLLNVVIKIADILCSSQGTFFSLFSDFYRELKESYSKLKLELSSLLELNDEDQFEAKKKKERVRITG